MHPFLAYTKKTTIKKAKTQRNKRKKEASPQRFSIVKATAPFFRLALMKMVLKYMKNAQMGILEIKIERKMQKIFEKQSKCKNAVNTRVFGTKNKKKFVQF